MTTKVKPSVLADTAVTPGTYGGSSQQAVFAVDAQGRLTYAGNATPSIFTSNGWSITTSNTKLYFSYNGTNLISLDQNGLMRLANTVITGVTP